MDLGRHPPMPHEFGPYSLVSLLGEGGMARVYRAVRRGPGGFRKELAIKRLRTDLTRGNKRLVDALINEAKLCGELQHPNVVDVYEFGVVGDEHYIAMEFVNGLTLSSLIRGCREGEALLPLGVVLDMALQVCAGLGYAHNRVAHDGRPMKLVHRDLKPSNIIVTTTGMVKIMDFGIARADMSERRETTDGVIKGTVSFMSPEQLQESGELDQRSDIFALGAVLFEALTSEPLITGTSVESLLFSIVSGKFRGRLDRVEERLPGILPILKRCLELDRDLRYPDVSELADDLREIRDQRGDRLACADLMRLLTTSAWDGEAHAGKVRSDILVRVERSTGDEDWEEFLASLNEVSEADEDPYIAGLQPPFDTLTLEKPASVADTVAATVMWRSEVAVLSGGISTGRPGSLRRIALWGVPVVLSVCALVAVLASRLAPVEGDAELPVAPGTAVDQPAHSGEEAEVDVTAAPAEELPEAGVVAEEAPLPDTPAADIEAAPDSGSLTHGAEAPPVEAEEAATDSTVAPILVTVNSDPWSYWTLSGDAAAGGGGAQVPYVGKLGVGTYQITLREPESGSTHVLDVVVTGDEERIQLCWDFVENAACKRAL